MLCSQHRTSLLLADLSVRCLVRGLIRKEEKGQTLTS